MKRTLLLSILVMPVTFLFMLQYGNPISIYIIGPIVEKEVTAHLKEKGYNSADLKVFRPEFGIPKVRGAYDPRYFVVFEGEPEVSYLYVKLRRGGKVAQYCYPRTYSETKQPIYLASDPLHLENECYDPRHYD